MQLEARLKNEVSDRTFEAESTADADTEAKGNMLSLLTYSFILSAHVGHPLARYCARYWGYQVSKMQRMLTTSGPLVWSFHLAMTELLGIVHWTPCHAFT